LNAGGVTFILDFFSPLDIKDFTRQSLPFSYLTVSVSNSNGASVYVYSDIDSTWLGSPSTASYNFTQTSANSVYSWTIPNAPQNVYTELDDQAQWGWAVFAASNSTSTQSGSLQSNRAQFRTNGALTNSQTNWAPGSSTAFAYNLGSVTSSTNVTFAIGYVRDNEVQYLGTDRTGYYSAKYPTISTTVDAFMSDYSTADQIARSLDATILSKAISAAGQDYANIATLSVLQTFGACDITIDFNSRDTSDPLIFIKEISSDGNVNTIDVINPAFPLFYVLNTDWIKLLLEPVLRYLATGRWPKPFMIHDIGTHYPVAAGHDNGSEEDMPVEESGNILHLVYAYTNASDDTTFYKKYATTLQSYADYLVANGEHPAYQLATDDGHGAGANYTNLGIKAAVGLTAFGALSGMSNYTDKGKAFANAIYAGGLGTDASKSHFTVFYGNDSSWGTPFNLFPDVLLGLQTFPTAAISMENAWYPQVAKTYGVQLDSRTTWGKTDWMMWAAATALGGSDGDAVRDMFVTDIHKFLVNTVASDAIPFEDRYFVDTGVVGPFRARPVVGGHWSLLALNGANQF
jgi:Domain of unknown function (DUF4965)/Domain of unknown function (DUF5127)/Domain of unknown function (DUF1793)